MLRCPHPSDLRNVAVSLAVLAVAACGSPAATASIRATASAAPATSTPAAASPSAAATATPLPAEPVLGAAAFTSPGGAGFGTYRPAKIDNGGDPSGRVDSITWTGWGDAQAMGTGSTSILSPAGGYYPTPGAAELRASDLGPCTPGGPLAYRHLEVREPSAPGGAMSDWVVWNDAASICTR